VKQKLETRHEYELHADKAVRTVALSILVIELNFAKIHLLQLYDHVFICFRPSVTNLQMDCRSLVHACA